MAMARAYLAPYGVGLGHASRLLSISERLKKDNITIKFSSYGEAVSYINNHGYECVEVPPIEFAWGKSGFSRNKKHFVVQSGHSCFRFKAISSGYIKISRRAFNCNP